jgi:hypothetical protein
MLRRTFASLLLVGLVASAPGCPAPAQGGAQTPQSLRLSFNADTGSAKVGERRGFVVSYGPQGEQLMSALIASEDGGPCVPKWHAEPADAVTFESDGAAATFTRPGTVKIWASLTNADGKEVASNPLEVTVAAQ